jgi:hypothetical protein
MGSDAMKLNPVHISLLIIPFIASPAAAHDWYSGLQTPSGVSCCNDGDCQRVGHRYSAETGHEIEIDDLWVRVDPGTILPLSSPDGLTHACFSRYRWIDPPSKTFINLRCVILGGMA